MGYNILICAAIGFLIGGASGLAIGILVALLWPIVLGGLFLVITALEPQVWLAVIVLAFMLAYALLGG